ncbi:MAG: DUF1330 domain-containing protein, partial [bacterium]|nr:DUF1330 domain-containing protein [bacterium]
MPTESQAKGYILAEIDVTDTAGYDSYKTLAAKAVSAFGGCYLVRGGSPQVLEGEHGCKRIV